METTSSPQTVPRERLSWVLLPLALVAYGCGLLFLLGLLPAVMSTVSAATSVQPMSVDLHGQTELGKASGAHSYSGGPYIADDAIVTVTGATALVSGMDAPTRVAVRLGPALWTATIVVVAAALGSMFARLRAREPRRSAARPSAVAAAALAVGSSAAQGVTAWANMRLGHVAWMGPAGVDGFSAIGPTVFDFRSHRCPRT
jgi:hypothetical protein